VLKKLAGLVAAFVLAASPANAQDRGRTDAVLPREGAPLVLPAPGARLDTLEGARAATTPAPPRVTVGPAGLDAAELLSSAVGQGEDPVPTSTAVRLLLFLTGLSFLPAMLVVMTPFVRFVVVFSLLRQALGVQQSPPNQVLIGLSLFLTLLVMEPVYQQCWTNGLQPFLDGTLPAGDAFSATLAPMREFMLANTRRSDMATILDVANMARPASLEEIPTSAVASAYVLSELKTAFVIAVYVFVPFLVIDLVVSSVLLGMGMMMLPPVLVSLPIKLMVFVLMDGWSLLVRDLVAGIVR
jgi:flagellar biosynthetic protein FliP